jgi:hypothetical protein
MRHAFKSGSHECVPPRVDYSNLPSVCVPRLVCPTAYSRLQNLYALFWNSLRE